MAAAKEGTPGMMRNGIESSNSRSICSKMAPYSDGSPECTRAIDFFCLYALLHMSMILSSTREEESMISAEGLVQDMTSLLTREPAYIIMSAFCIAF